MPIGVAVVRDTGCTGTSTTSKRVASASLRLLLVIVFSCAISFSGFLGGRDGGGRNEYEYKYYRGDVGVGVDGIAASATGAAIPNAAFGQGEGYVPDGSSSTTKERERRTGGDSGDVDGGDDSSSSGLHLHLHPPLVGTVGAVYDLMDRVLKDPNAKNSFRLRIVNEDEYKGGKESSSSTQSWFRLEQQQKGTAHSIDNHNHNTNTNTNTNTDADADTTIVVAITATSANELTAGLGYYFKHYCNFTLEWSTGGRAGGEHIVLPDVWPVPLLAPGAPEHETTVVRRRTTQLSYLMNVCTHSYSLVWYDWPAWQNLIDNMALRGINMVLALTGQEEIQYKVFSKLGLEDHDIRSWFNGPAFLTWSRGQNEYGSGIAGPLPRSFMTSQWELQRDYILPRMRGLGMVGILPAFQGNVPVQLKTLYNDSNITQQGDTGWIDALDPLFLKIADAWMAQLIEDFGTDHYYQLDGWFNGGVPPWMTKRNNNDNDNKQQPTNKTPSQTRQKLAANADTQTAAQRQAFGAEQSISISHTSRTLRATPSTAVPSHDENWYRRGQAAYTGLNRTDPDAHWMYQGFAFVGWETNEQASYVKGFVDSAPHGKFVVIDMEYSPDGEWQKWANASFFGAPFIWSKLHNFGDTTGMRGDIENLNWAFPYQALEARSSIIGIGATPEGIDQNPLYYDFLYEQNFRSEPVENITAYLIGLIQKRYGMQRTDKNVVLAWTNLLKSSYSQDFSVQDLTGVAHLKPRLSSSLFERDRSTPKPLLCNIFNAWKDLICAGDNMELSTDPFLYDLVNVGREVMAQLTTPMALNFSDARSREFMDHEELVHTGELYVELLLDLDRLLGTNIAFLLRPWLESARHLAQEDARGDTQHDCFSPILGNQSNPGSCSRFYEFNARTQITTWNPTPYDANEVPGGPIDYAAKHWSGLVREYYAKRATLLLEQALRDQQNGQPLNSTTVNRIFAIHAYEWTTTESSEAVAPRAQFTLPNYHRSTLRMTLDVSKEMLEKYSHWFKECG